jgi:hypothetical protein
MSNGKPAPRSIASLDKDALQSGVEKLGRSIKELQDFKVAEIGERGDVRLDHLRRRANNNLSDIVGIGSAEYKKHSVPALDASLDTTFGERYSMEEIHDALKAGIKQAVQNFTALRKLLSDELAGKSDEAAAPPPAPPPAPAPPPPAPAPEPVPAPAPAKSKPEPTPSPEPTRMNKPTAPAPSPEGGNRRVLILGDGGDTTVQLLEFLEQLGLESAILDTPSVERLDSLRDAAFALLMPSPDSEGASTMLAIGFMLAVLGRQRICLLAAPGQATSSVLEGVLRIAPDETGVWRLLLAREMKRAGLDVDLNKAA